MKYIEKVGDLFAEKNCYYAHCISADFALGAGIAVEFNKRYNMSKQLKEYIKDYPQNKDSKCIAIENVFNLITKDKYYNKPTYDSLKASLEEMKDKIEKRILFNEWNESLGQYGLIDHDIYKLAIPLLGCGLDRLKWEQVSQMIKEIFDDIDVEIVVCKLK